MLTSNRLLSVQQPIPGRLPVNQVDIFTEMHLLTRLCRWRVLWLLLWQPSTPPGPSYVFAVPSTMLSGKLLTTSKFKHLSSLSLFIGFANPHGVQPRVAKSPPPF